MAERGAFEDAMDAAFANVRWMQVGRCAVGMPPAATAE
jgi:hypothetical protein